MSEQVKLVVVLSYTDKNYRMIKKELSNRRFIISISFGQ